MRAALAWRRWRDHADPAAREALLRHHRYLGDRDTLAAALDGYTGRPGGFAAYVRHRAADEPHHQGQAAICEAPPAPLATAYLHRSTRAAWYRTVGALLKTGCKTASRDDLNRIVLQIEPGMVRIFSRCWSHAVAAAVPAVTSGQVTVSFPRIGIRLKDFEAPGTLELHSNRLHFIPENGEPFTVSTQPANFPELDRDALAGVLISRIELQRVLDGAPEAVELLLQGRRLQVDGAEIATSYGTGTARLLLARRFVEEALKTAGGEEVVIEALDAPGRPARISSADGGYQMLVAQRLETSLLGQL